MGLCSCNRVDLRLRRADPLLLLAMKRIEDRLDDWEG